MKIEFDHATDVLDVRLIELRTMESEDVQPGVTLDFDDSGKVVGVDLLSVSKRESNPLTKAA